MTVRLSQLADIDWKNSVPNQKGELDKNEIDNLRYIIQNIEVFKNKKSIILSKCWKYINRLESPEKIIEAAKIIEANRIDELPIKQVDFLGEKGWDVPFFHIKVIEKLVPGLNLKQLTKRQFDLIIALFEDKKIEINAEDILGLEKVAEKFNFQALRDKLLPMKERFNTLLEETRTLNAEEIRDLAALYATTMPKDRENDFDRIADRIINSDARVAYDEKGKFLRTLTLDEKNRFISLLKDHLKDKPDDIYFSWHQLLHENGIYDHQTPKGFVPSYLIDKLVEKYPSFKGPIDQWILRFISHAEFKDIYAIPPLEIDKKNISLILAFLISRPSGEFEKSKVRVNEALLEIIKSLNPKNRDDLVVAVNIQNYLTKNENKRYEATLQRLFNRELDEARELSFWEKIVGALVTFFGLAFNEWVRVDKAFLLKTLNQLNVLDIELRAESTKELWPFIIQHKGLRSLDLSDIHDLPDALILELPLTLEHLNLRKNKLITNKIIAHIEKMPNLKSINVSKTMLSWQDKVRLKCLCEPIDLREFYVNDALLKMIPKNAKSVLLGRLNPDYPDMLTKEGIAYLTHLKELRHLEIAFLPIQPDLKEVLKLPNLTSLKLVEIESKFKNVEPLFFDSRLETLVLDSCKLVDHYWYDSISNSHHEKSILKKLVLNNSKIQFDKDFVDSLDEITLDCDDYSGYVYVPILQKCKKMFVPNEKIRNEILNKIYQTGFININKNELAAKIIVQEV